MNNFLFIIVLSFFMDAKEPPPGTILIKGMYVDKTEVTNMAYLEFLNHMKPRMVRKEYKMLVPDKANFWYTKGVNKHKPIVNISWAQAMLYCEWRTAMVQQKTGLPITYRLIKPEEWVEIGQEVLRNDLERVKEERKKSREVMEKKGSSYYYLKSNPQPQDQIYNYFDNVSEMTLEKGVAMGDNNIDMSDDLESNLSRIINYTSPNAFLGFRCIAEYP